MREQIAKLLAQKQLLAHTSLNILTVTTQDTKQLTKDIFYNSIDQKTLLFLSGGRSPKTLYNELGREKALHPGSVALVDERYGKPLWEDSNERMLQESGFRSYFSSYGVPFTGVLQEKLSLEETADMYDQKIRGLLQQFPGSVALLGIGLDGHIAGIPAGREKLEEREKTQLVTYYPNFPGPQKERVSLTFLGLSMIDLLIVLVEGEDKKDALDMLFSEGSEEEVPARFLKRPDIANKTLLVTDQKI